MPSALEQQLQRHRSRLIEHEEAAFRELLEAYEVIERDLAREYRKLQRQIAEAQAAGETISEAWLYRQRRLASLLDQVKQQVERFGQTAAAITTREQRAAIRIAAEQTNDLFRVITGAATLDLGSTLPTRVIEDAVGMMGDGSPILNYYREKLAPKVAEMIRTEVIKAAATGTDFRTIASRLMTTGQITRTRALMAARTEVNRVRREATRQRYIESGVTTGWEWVASKSIRTCPACLWMDGQIFKLEDPFPQHPNCRCTMMPVIEGVERPPRTLGREWFERLTDEEKEKILGIEAAAAYKRGDVTLEDFRGWRNSKEFGRAIYTRSLASIQNAGGQKREVPKDLGIDARTPTGAKAKEVAEILENAGFDVGYSRAKTTNSHYLFVGKDDVTAKIRISDHKPNASAVLALDLRADSQMDADSLIARVRASIADMLDVKTAEQARLKNILPLRSELSLINEAIREIKDLKQIKIGDTVETRAERLSEFERRKAELADLNERKAELLRLLKLAG